MSEAKFTKGEWIVDYDNCDYGSGEWYIVGNARVEFSYRATSEEKEEAKANAHLIAAAPEMYSELDELSGIIRRMGVESASDRIDQLLKKARGEK
ncbi:MAG: hypothetical protein ACPG5V_13675 [Vibrio cyclitrophicus]